MGLVSGCTATVRVDSVDTVSTSYKAQKATIPLSYKSVKTTLYVVVSAPRLRPYIFSYRIMFYQTRCTKPNTDTHEKKRKMAFRFRINPAVCKV